MKKILLILLCTFVIWIPSAQGITAPLQQSQFRPIALLSWSPAGNFIAVMEDAFGPIHLLNTNLEFVRTISGQGTVIWKPDGTLLASVDRLGILIIDPYSGDEVQRIEVELTSSPAAAWHPTENLLAAALGGTVFIYDLDTKERVDMMRLHDGNTSSQALLWHPDGIHLLSGGDDRTLRIWNTETDTIITYSQGEKYGVFSLALNPDATQVALDAQNDMVILELSTGTEVRTLIGHTKDIISIDWSTSGLVASTSVDSSIIIWDSDLGKPVEIINTGRINQFAWNPDGTQYVYWHSDLDEIEIASAPTTSSELSATITTANGTSEPDTICLTDSATYTFTTAHIPLNALPAITSDITICSTEGATLTRQAGSPLFGFFEVSAGGSLTLDNLTLSGGDVGNDTGGALVNEGGTVTLNNVTFTNNHANTGGAIDNENGSLTITDSTFENNQADYGGAIDNDTGGTLSTSGSTFTSNTAALDGGAIHNDGGTLTVTDSTFTTNTAGRYGGALDNTGSATISGSTFSGNAAGASGGAIRNSQSMTITDSVVSGNSATSSYGSLYLTSSSTTTAHNSCFSNNTATSVGHTGTTMQDFTGNWWGAADGPSGSGPGSGDAVNNRINYASFLTAGCPHP